MATGKYKENGVWKYFSGLPIKISDGLHVYSHNGQTQNELSVDASPTQDSNNLITSGGVNTSLNNKQNKITQSDSAPSSPLQDDLWIDTSISTQIILKRYNGTAWENIGAVDKTYNASDITNDSNISGSTVKEALNLLNASSHSHDNKILLDGLSQTNIDNWNTKYDKPSTGIPKADLESSIQTSLTNADNALQADDLNSVNISTFVNDSGYLTENGIFWCTYGTTTYDQITVALSENKIPVLIYDNMLYQYSRKETDGSYDFTGLISNYSSFIFCNSSSNWSNGRTIMAIQSDITKPYVTSITLSTDWEGDSSPYSQIIVISGYNITSYTKIDIEADTSVLASMSTDKVTELYIQNNNRILTAYAVGGKPTTQLTVQASLYEVTT